MSEIREYPAGELRFGTFSYLPPMTADELVAQVEYLIDQGWNPSIEHVEPGRTGVDYWYLWKLPMFGERSAAAVLAEADACADAHPGHYVRVMGYDNQRQSVGAVIIAHRGS